MLASLSFNLSKHSLLSLYLVLTTIILLFPLSMALMAETEALLQFKKQLNDPLNSLESWKETSENSPCDFVGISCDMVTRKVTSVNLENKSLSGEILPSISILQSLTSLLLAFNSFSGYLPYQLVNCTKLQVLNVTENNFNETLPNISSLTELQVLDLSANHFSGPFPDWVGKLTRLTSLDLGENDFDESEIPKDLGKLKKLTWLGLADCNIVGEIPKSIFELKSLQTLDLCKNKISGKFPKAISYLRDLNKIELYANNLTGEIPPEFVNLTLLREFDISKNQMSGKLPDQIGSLKKLVVFQLYDNYFTGEIPKGFEDMKYLEAFSVYRNNFSGEFPGNLGRFSPLKSIDISENQFSGEFPRFLCENKNLQFLLALNNKFSGELPASYAECKSLERFRISKNQFFGKISDGIWGMPNAKIIDFGDNGFTGGVSSEIRMSTSLNQLILENNMFSGELPSELGKLTQLERLSANNNTFAGKLPPHLQNLKQLSSLHLGQNRLTGPILSELGECTRLVDLNLAENSLSGDIPKTLSQLSSLNSLNLSHNHLSGSIPENLQKLKLSSIDFSDNQLTGRIPSALATMGVDRAFLGNTGLCIDLRLKNQINSVLDVCTGNHSHKKGLENRLVLICIISLAVVIIFSGLLLVSYRNFKLEQSTMKEDLEGSQVKDSCWKLESFHQAEFDTDEISNLDEENLIGIGSTGKVYRLDLKKKIGETVAIKQLWKGNEVKVLTAEMEILGKIRHKNIVKLYACLIRGDSNILVLEYMVNGNLYQALRRQIKGGRPELDWILRYKIAVGAAKGIAYLHHDCSPSVIHRDIKSSNILLNENYEPKIADFGIARVIDESSKGSDLSCFAGTLGYIAPELAYSLKLTEKSDVYGFGVVLLELITGRNPIEAEYGEGKDIVYWVSSHLNCPEDILEVLDKKVSDSIEDDMIKVLKVALHCTTKLPSLRPNMRDVVKMLVDADPSTATVSDKTLD
ncbi:hypothetical protein GIB67_041325 [Kingdonia uniflora]|uniref:non-specific serine/threonine protein kinase n=1 Tax=Kingdonia uniflora TaxID=39325 RepID=A0A7J7NJ81_9MAGN|nr:hypothetical protein GIB67_041325 [Kingdonia uniflora]